MAIDPTLPQKIDAPTETTDNMISDTGEQVALGPLGRVLRGQVSKLANELQPNDLTPENKEVVQEGLRKAEGERAVEKELSKQENVKAASDAVEGAQVISRVKMGDAAGDLTRDEARNRAMYYFNWTPEQASNSEFWVDELQQYAQPRMGVRSVQMTQEAAGEISKKQTAEMLALDYRHSNGRPLLAEELLVVKNGLELIGTEIDDQMNRIGTKDVQGRWTIVPGVADKQKTDFMALINRFSMLDSAFRGSTKEAGRLLRMTREQARGWVDERDSHEVLAGFGGTLKVERMMELWSQTNPADITGRLRLARQATKGNVVGAMYELWRGNLLFSPKTWMRNILGNATHGMIRSGAAWREAFTHALVDRNMDPIIAQATASRMGLEMIPQLLNNMKIGYMDELRMAEYLEKGGRVPRWLDRGGSKLDDFRYPEFVAESFGLDRDAQPVMAGVVDWLGIKARTSYNVMGSLDAGHKSSRYMMSLAKMAREKSLKEAREKGLSRKKEMELFDEYMMGDIPDDWHKLAREEAREITFQTRGGDRNFRNWASAIRNNDPTRLMQWLMPFTQTPANILSAAVRYTPGLNLMGKRGIFADFKSGDPKRKAVATTRIIQSSALVWYMQSQMETYETTEDGVKIWRPRITGGFPKGMDKGALLRQGFKPYSIWVGDRYVSYSAIEPAGMVMAMMADSIYTTKNMAWSSNPKQWATNAFELSSALIVGIGEYLVDKSMFTGVSRLLTAVSQEEIDGWERLTKAGGEVAGSMVRGSVPNIVHQVNKSLKNLSADEYAKRYENYFAGSPVEDFMARTFKARGSGKFNVDTLSGEGIPPSYDPWGKMRTWNDPLVPFDAVFNPFLTGPEIKPNEKDAWVLRLGIKIGRVPRKVAVKGRLEGQGADTTWHHDPADGQPDQINLDELDQTGFAYSRLQYHIGLAQKESFEGLITDDHFKRADSPEEIMFQVGQSNVKAEALEKRLNRGSQRWLAKKALDMGRKKGILAWHKEYAPLIKEFMNTGDKEVEHKSTIFNTPPSEIGFGS